MKFAQALTKINSLTFLNSKIVESTFYKDFENVLTQLVDREKIIKDYKPESIEQAELYKVDYKITAPRPVFVFPVLNKGKARLVTITLQHLLSVKANFTSLIVFQDQTAISPSNLFRLTNASDMMIPSLLSTDSLKRKIDNAFHTIN